MLSKETTLPGNLIASSLKIFQVSYAMGLYTAQPGFISNKK